MDGQPAARASVSMQVLGDDSTLVFDEDAQLLFSLNPVSAFLWCLMEEGHSAEAMARELAGRSGMARAEAARSVALCLEDWRRHGLIAGGPASLRSPRIGATIIAPPARLEAPPGPVVREIVGTLPGLGFSIRLATRGAEGAVLPMVAHLAAAATPDVVIDAAVEGSGHEVLLGGIRMARAAAIEEVAPGVKYALTQALLDHGRFSVAFHAATLVVRARTLLLAAAPGSGKTTLSAALAARGHGFAGDDIALFDEEAGTVAGVPFCLAVKAGSWPILEPLFPALAGLPVHRRADDKLVRYLPPPGPAPDPAPPGWVVFPKYRKGVKVAVTAIDRAEALSRLFHESFAPSHRLGRRQFDRLADWMRGARAWQIEYGTLAEGVAAVEEACAVHA
jgi:hypothetical protein